MYKTLIIEPQEFSLRLLQNYPIWGEGDNDFCCSKTASNGEEALELLNTEHFDLVLTEINLPFLDGLQLLKKIHKDNQPPIIVFISDIVSFSYAREGFIYGVFDYFPKPVSQESMKDLLARVAKELEKYKNIASQIPSQSKRQSYFSQMQVLHIVNGFISNNINILSEFKELLFKLYVKPNATLVPAPDIVANQFYLDIVDELYSKFEWLTLYLPQDFHKKIDYLVLTKADDYIDFYHRKLTQLYRLFTSLFRTFPDKTLHNVYNYMLLHPEEDLKLKSMADRFYINHTYLSNLFSKKSLDRFSQLVTMIKMKRAEYLFIYEELSIIDVVFHLGYKDVNYFTRIYKTTIGKSPSEYIHSNNTNYSI